MTRPAELKPREDEQPGTPAEAFEVGEPLPEMRFTLTPDIVEEYMQAVEADPSPYQLEGRRVAPPNVLAVYQLAVLYRRYPPIQGIILTEQSWEWHLPIWADEATELLASGRVLERYERRGKQYVRWSADFRRARDGATVATSVNTLYVPE